MRIAGFEWDDENEEHVSRHGVVPAETEEVLRLGPYLRRGRLRTYLAYGPTAEGRLLLVVFRLTTRPGGVARVITARDLTRREREAWRRRKKR